MADDVAADGAADEVRRLNTVKGAVDTIGNILAQIGVLSETAIDQCEFVAAELEAFAVQPDVSFGPTR